ncbi:transport protein [Lactiplantibacillus plantarum]|uniref:AI-2E family transporter n=1 Tax=Lactiplantibacillus plantarum TaxID=1590 RepID=UPI0013038136|nr:AI-2E family transporter [Lactiplantibacillus plantarum]MCG0596263.1 transport protein [Lactiplantibacillus plantarum]MCG0624914.1 transport protein [Lactiplantibacillus plantarum]MCG0751941.1 transport protein [Lactiplantibacillus plantarum]MCG0761138.1 transport protein [Lactiplantibacillus plantarum]MCG0888216.1 transport protein [Lactiplantibacillus plantarum]
MKPDSQKQRWSAQRLIRILVVILLVLTIFFMGKQVDWLLDSVRQFFSIVGLPIILAGVLYYLLNPLVDWLEKRFRVRRTWTIIGLFIVVVALLALGIIAIIPTIRDQTLSIINDWPNYWKNASTEVNRWLNDPQLSSIRDQLESWNTDLSKLVSGRFSKCLTGTVTSLTGVFSTVTTVIIGLITMPFILFYLLRDGHQLPKYMAKFVPTKARSGFLEVLTEINSQVSNYIRGQLTVAFFVAVMFAVGYSIIGLKFALTLGIAAGILNLIPYLGSFLAMVPSVVIALVTSPWMLVQVLIVFVIEQTIEGRFISPLVLGSSLAIHPITILVVLLAAGKIFGLMGVIFGIPGYAILKVLWTHLFDWYRRSSGLYEAEATPSTDQTNK